MGFTTILAYVFVGAPIAVFFATQILYVVGTVTKNHYIDFYARCAASFTALVICATYGTLASACLNVVGYGGLGQWTTARAFIGGAPSLWRAAQTSIYPARVRIRPCL